MIKVDNQVPWYSLILSTCSSPEQPVDARTAAPLLNESLIGVGIKVEIKVVDRVFRDRGDF